MGREIRVTKCGEIEGCEFNDRISIEFSPFDLLILKEIFEERATKAIGYNQQGDERDMRELFAEAREIWKKERMWEKERAEKDK